MAQEIKAAKRVVNWYTEIFSALIDSERYEELRGEIERVGESIEAWGEVADRMRGRNKRLFLQIEQLKAEQGAAERRPPAQRLRRGECSIEIVESEVGPCIRCCGEVGRGLVGWRWQPETGPLCYACLADVDLDLATVMVMVQRMRQLAAGGSRAELNEMLELARAYAEATAGAWPLRSLGVGHLLAGLLEHAEREHGPFWLSDLENGPSSEPN